MSNSTILYGQLMGYLRQHSQYRDLRHLKARSLDGECPGLQWAVELGGMGTRSALSRSERAKQRTTLATIYEQRPDSGEVAVSAVSHGGFERMAIPSALLGIRHDHAVGSILHDSPVGGLLRTSRAEKCGAC